jgi:hypothetical protein
MVLAKQNVGKSFSGYTQAGYKKYDQFLVADVYLNHCRLTAYLEYLP